MITRDPWAVRLLAVPLRMAAYVTRAVLAAVGADPMAVAVFGVVLLVVTLSLPLALRIALLAGRRVDRALAAHRTREEQRAFTEIVQQLGDGFPADAHDGHTQIMPGVTRLGPPAPPPVRHAVKHRRMPGVRIPRRRARHTTSTSDRSSRS